MSRIRFEDTTPINKGNLNKLNNVVISPTETTTGEEVWIQKGKNLCNITSVTPYNYGSGLPTSITDKITINSFDKNNINFKVNANAYIYALTNIIKLEPNTTYTLSYDRTNTNYSGSNSRCYILNYDNGTYSTNGSVLVGNGTSITRTFTTNSTGAIAIAWGFSNDGNGATVDISNIQLEQGSSKTTYEPYIDKKIYTKNDNGVYEEFYNETNLENYSLGEQRIGTWLGKPLYRKVVETTVRQTGLNFLSGTDFDMATNMYGVIGYENGVHNLGSYYGDYYSLLQYNKSEKKFWLYCSSNYFGNKAQICVEYTKTTD